MRIDDGSRAAAPRARIARIEVGTAKTPLASITPDGWVHTGAITPHALESGKLVERFADLDAGVAATLRRGTFRDLCGERVRTQAWQAVANLRRVLDAASTGPAALVRMRVFLRRIVDESFAIETLAAALDGALPSLQVVECDHAAIDPRVALWLDAVAYAPGGVKHVRVPDLDAFTAPFPAASVAAGVVMTSLLPGRRPRRDPPTQLDALVVGDELRRLVDALEPLPPRSLAFVCQQAQMASNLRTVLEHAGTTPREVVHLHYWSGVSMREMGNATLTRVLDRIFGDHAITSFPPTGMRFPGSLAEGAVIAATAAEGKVVRLPRDTLSGAYVPAAQAGSLLFTAGEVPIERSTGDLMVEPEALPAPWNTLLVGNPVGDRSAVKAAAIYASLARSLATCGCTFADVVRQDLYLADVETSFAVERVAATMFDGRPPPTSIVPIVEASPSAGARMEIELTCSVPAGSGR